MTSPGTGAGDTEYVGRTGEAEAEPFPVFLLTPEAAEKVAALAGSSLAELGERQAAAAGGFSWAPEGLHARCRLAMGEPETLATRNVLGIIPGRDEHLFRQFVVVSAHYDHLGRGEDGLVRHGADDNASGVAALLGAAKALAGLPPYRRPLRSVLFAAWGAEEKGVLGSGHYLDHPVVPLGQVKALLNLDMVGRDNQDLPENANVAAAFYSAQAPGLEALLDGAAAAAGLDLRLRPLAAMHGNSDHRGFHERRIPAVHFFTGLHRDYDQPGDTAERINYPKLLRISRLVAALAYALAEDEAPLPFDETITAPQGRQDPFELPF